jgi:Fe-S cluster biogenesis protein NfuA
MQQNMRERQQRAARIEALIQEIAEFPDPRARATTEELVQALVDMYGEGLARMLEMIAQSEAPGSALIAEFAHDDLVGSLLLLHGLHPVAIETRIAQALDGVRPYLKAHGCSVEFVTIANGVAHLRLVGGACSGCSSSISALRQAVEEAIYNAAPDLDGLQIEEVSDQPARSGIPVRFVPPRRRRDNAHVTASGG